MARPSSNPPTPQTQSTAPQSDTAIPVLGNDNDNREAIGTQPGAPLTNGHISAASTNGTMANGTHRDEDSCSSSGRSVARSVSTTTDAPPEPTDEDDLDRFLRRIDSEKKMVQLQQRLQFASIKANHGWADMSINEIETRLPLTEQRRPQVVIPGGRGIAYEPPSPQRPWQLADSLWQNLPKPGQQNTAPTLPAFPGHPGYGRRPAHAMHAPSHSLPGGLPSLASLQMPVGPPRGLPPASPRRHGRMEEHLSRSPASSMPPPGYGHGRTQSHSSKNTGHSNGHHGRGAHRRSNSSISAVPFLGNDPYPAVARQKKSSKKRSQSHSNLREHPTTQDVDAARALTSMLEASRSPNTPSHERLPSLGEFIPPPPDHRGPRLPPLHSTTSFPPPFASEMQPPRQRAQSFATVPGDIRAPPRTLPPPMGPPDLRAASSHTHHRGTSMDSSGAFRGGFWQAHGAKPSFGRSRDFEREREARERDRQRERERERSERERNSDRMMDERLEEVMANRPQDDQTAVELMMYLAQSPSPVRKRAQSDAQASFSTAARVLFSEDGRERDPRMREPAPGPRPGPPSLPAPRLR
ncbi:hypothetical protein CspeluHIS016_0304860 [Cutaneotrichosporon spelunceum]|uniref:Uncharacterized protein n=1 Tax=Cutaneotrichosporon spelunceum TaxID=1672016 RepID=A0AAD3YB48_9TREE|nr:hypothetical protein CspeluHIS016_0304860 [Cutaneotrichosporon spelunceum]